MTFRPQEQAKMFVYWLGWKTMLGHDKFMQASHIYKGQTL
jgi:hypothetical protein